MVNKALHGLCNQKIFKKKDKEKENYSRVETDTRHICEWIHDQIITGGDTTAEEILEERGERRWELKDKDATDIGFGKAGEVSVSSDRTSTMGVYTVAKGTHGEEEGIVCPGKAVIFEAPSGESWASVKIKGFGTEDQFASGTIKWS